MSSAAAFDEQAGMLMEGCESGTGLGARVRARAATPWTCAQRRGRRTSRSVRASSSAPAMEVRMRSRLGRHRGTFTDALGHLGTSETSRVPACHGTSRHPGHAAYSGRARQLCPALPFGSGLSGLRLTTSAPTAIVS